MVTHIHMEQPLRWVILQCHDQGHIHHRGKDFPRGLLQVQIVSFLSICVLVVVTKQMFLFDLVPQHR